LRIDSLLTPIVESTCSFSELNNVVSAMLVSVYKYISFARSSNFCTAANYFALGEPSLQANARLTISQK